MKVKMSTICIIYYILQIISLIILILPSDFKMAVYTPNYLGYFWLSLYPVICFCFLYLTVVDIKNNNIKLIKKRIDKLAVTSL